MIFCTIGTTPFPFDRIICALDEALAGGRERLIVQTGQKNYMITHKPTTVFQEVRYEKILYYLSHARALICHGGAGTVLLALKYANVKPFVLPRQVLFKEHVDDHQLYFSEYMRSRGFIVTPSDLDHVTHDLRAYILRPPVQKHNASNSPRKQFVYHLTSFINDYHF